MTNVHLEVVDSASLVSLGPQGKHAILNSTQFLSLSYSMIHYLLPSNRLPKRDYDRHLDTAAPIVGSSESALASRERTDIVRTLLLHPQIEHTSTASHHRCWRTKMGEKANKNRHLKERSAGDDNTSVEVRVRVPTMGWKGGGTSTPDIDAGEAACQHLIYSLLTRAGDMLPKGHPLSPGNPHRP